MPAFQPQRFGHYVLTAHLGRGGMADVFRAQKVGIAGFERTVVVKRILAPYNEDPTFVQMLINEAKIAASLQHPNIVQVYELGEVDGEYFMAMEYVRGKDLLHLLRFLAKGSAESRSLPPDVAAYVARETCRALGHAHDHADEAGRPAPIVHRDVSPQNIMIGYDGQVKLVDFGIAKAMMSAREETRTGALKGKIAYMSPEQVSGTSPGPESDLFSTGVVLYEMLIGRRLFKGQNDFDTIARVKSMPIPPPSQVAPWVPAELDHIVMSALERDRSLRYARAAAMARDLDGYLSSVRFSLEQMAEYMAATLPPEARDEVPDGQAREPSMSPSLSRSRAPSGVPAGATNPGTPSAHKRERSQSDSGARTPRGGRTAVVATAALAALLVGGAGVLIGAGLRREPAPPLTAAPVVFPVEVQPDLAPEPKAAAPVLKPAAAPVPKAAAPELKPAAAPELKPAPTPEPPPAVTATRPGGSGSDRPRASSNRPTPARSQAASPPPRPKIEVFEDGERPAPKIETFED